MTDDRLSHQARREAAELLASLRSLHSSIDGALSRVSGGAAQGRLAATLSQVAGMETVLAQTLRSGGSLAGIDFSAIARLIQSSEAIVSGVELAGDAGKAPLNLADASAATRQEVQTLSQDLFERRIFDPYLHFGSAKDEAEYRAREAERQRAIAAELARRTPEGNLNAGGLAAGQMLDAHTHGAGASPDFLPRWSHLMETLNQQRAAMHAAGHSTEAFDRQIAADVRTFLKAKGLSDAEIDAHLAASPAPLDAVRPYLADDRDTHSLDQTILHATAAARAVTLPLHVEITEGARPTAASEIDFNAMAAKLQAAGVRMTDTAPTTSDHGLSVEEAVRPTGRGVQG